jgi:hypothetical protein
MYCLDRSIALKSEDAQMAVVEQGCKAKAVLDAVNKTIDRKTKTVVFLSLQARFLGRNFYRTRAH